MNQKRKLISNNEILNIMIDEINRLKNNEKKELKDISKELKEEDNKEKNTIENLLKKLTEINNEIIKKNKEKRRYTISNSRIK